MTRDDFAGCAAKKGRGFWARRMLQGAVAIAVAASVQAAWSAGGPAGLTSGTMGGIGGGLGTGIQVNNVAAGSAIFSQQGLVTTVRTGSQTTIINYQRLTVGAGETLEFLQPSTLSRVLNRIQGAEPTQINGTVTSNGQVYFVNPAGVLFGNGSVINVGGLYAAAGHMADSDFLSGNNQFTGNTGIVENDGAIHADQVHLVGQNVVNTGQISTGITGIVTLTAGNDVYIGQTSSPTGGTTVMVKVSSDTSTTHDGTGVSNTGSIDVGKGQLRMGAGDLYAAGIYNSGSLKGQAITLDSGKNTNISTGNIDASNAQGTGGTVQLLGDRVGVDGGVVDASGASGGGVIRVGGDFHGAGDTPTASRTYVSPDAVLKADALVSGNGGQVVVWANDVTRYYGNISAAGGALGGNGGYVEVSGKNELVFSGAVNTLAAHGVTGTLLLDPSSIDVNSAGTAGFTALNQVDQFADPDSGNNRIDPTTINAATSNVVLEATGTITFTSAISMSNTGVGLTARSGGNITVNADITTKGGAIVLSAGDTGTSGAGSSANGTITINNQTISTTGGAATGGDITLQAHDVTIDPSATIDAGTGTVFFYTNIASQAINIGGVGGYNLTTAELNTVIQNAANIEIGQQGVQTGDITLDVATNYLYNPNKTVGIRLNTSGNLALNGTLSPNSVNDHLNLTLSGGTVTVSGAIDLGGGQLFANGGSFTATANINSTNDINIMPTGPVSLQALVDATSVGTVRLGGSTITESGSGEIVAGKLAIQATDDVTLELTNSVASLGAINTTSGKMINFVNGGPINFNTVSAATVPGGFSAFGAVSGIQTNNGNIVVQSFGNMVVSNPLSAGTGNVSLSTAATSGGNINDSGAANVTSGANITLNADGGIGTSAAPVLAPTGDVSLTTAGTNAAGNISVAFFTSGAPGTLAISQITGITTDAGTTQSILLTVNGNVTIDSAFAVTGDTPLGITAVGGNINGDGNAAHAISATTVNLTAVGIGDVNAVSVVPGTAATITTTGSGGAGDMRITTTAGLGEFTFNSDNATSQSVVIENSGAMNITSNLSLEAGDTLVLHAGARGTGNLTFTGVPTISADSIVLWAGIGDGTGSTAIVDLSSAPVLANHTGAGAPASLTIRQDASITDAVLTTANFAGAALPANYTLRSDGGNVTVATAANVAGTNLSLTATSISGAINLNVPLTGGNSVASLTVFATTLNIGANVASTGDQLYSGVFQLTQNETLTGGNLTFNGAINSQANQFWTLTTTGSGTVWFKADIGGTAGGGNELGALVSNGSGVTRLGSGSDISIVTKQSGGADGHVSLNNTVLFSNTTITTTTTTPVGSLGSGVADVTFTGTVDSESGGDFSLTVNSPGVTWFQGNVGQAGGGVLGGILTDFQGGAFEGTKLGNGGSVSISTGSPITFNDPVVLMADTSLSAANPAGDVTFNRTVDSDSLAFWNLTISAGNSINFNGNVGAASFGPLGAITTNGTATLNMGNGGAFTIRTVEKTGIKGNATGAQTFNNPIVLNANTTIIALTATPLGSLVAGEDDVTFNGSMLSQASQFFGINVNTPGVTWFKGGVSGVATQELGSITTDFEGGALEVTKFGTSGAITVLTKAGGSATGAQIYNDEVVLTGDTTFRGPSLAFNQAATALNGSSFNLTLASDSMTLGTGANSVQGSGNLQIQPLLDTDAIVIGSSGAAANTLFLSRTSLASLQTGFASITIGSSTGSHVITIASDSGSPYTPVTFRDPTTIQSPNGSITVNMPTGAPILAAVPGLYGDVNANLTLTAAAITLNASIMTNGKNITINGPVMLGSPSYVLLKTYGTDGTNLFSAGTAGGNITIAGTVDDDSTPTLLDLVANGSVTNGNMDVQGVVGGVSPLDGFFANGWSLKLGGNLSTTGPGTYSGNVILDINTITLVGNANPAISSTFTIDTDSSGGTADAGSFSTTGTIDHLAGTGAVSLVIDTSATGGHAGSDITLLSVGASQPLAGLSLIAGTGNVSVADVTLTGPFSSSGAAFGNSGVISTANNSVTINQTGAVTLGAALSAGTGAVSITGVGVSSTFAITGGSITLASGSGNVSLGGLVTASGPFSSTGPGASTFTLGVGGGINAGNNTVTINHGGLVTLNSAISAGTGAVSITGTGITSASGVAITGGSITLASGTGNVGLGGLVTASGPFSSTGTGTSTFTLGVGGGINAGNNTVTINHGGLVTLNSAISAGTGAVSITGTGITTASTGTISGGSITLASGTGNVGLTGLVTGSGPFSSTGTGASTFTINTGGGIDTSANGTSITINQGGLVTLDSTVDAGGASVNITGAGIDSISGATITGGVVTLTSGASNLLLVGAVDATSLVLKGSGSFTISDANINNLAANTTGPITLTNGSDINITSAGSPSVVGVTSTGDVTLSASGNTTLSQNITSTGGNITINTPLIVPSGSLIISASGNITTGDITGSGNLTLGTGTPGSSVITVGAIGTSVSSRFGNITFLSANDVVLGGNIFAGNVSFQDNIGDLTTSRTDVPQTATISSNTGAAGDHTLTIDADGTFVMEKNQKLTVYDSSGTSGAIGNLTIKTNHHGLTVGDLSALGKIDLDAGDVNSVITLINRAPQRERLPGGGLSDPDLGMDIVAGFNGVGAITMRGTVAVVGGNLNHRVQFSAVDASTDIQSIPGVLNFLPGSNLAVIPVNIPSNSLITESKMVFGMVPLDLIAIGVNGQSPSSIQGSVVPRDIQTLEPEREEVISGALRDALRELGIYARDPNTDEVVDYLTGRALWNDVPYKLDPSPTDTTVVSNRMPFGPIVPTVEAFRDLFFKPEFDDKGNPVMENGKPKLAPQDRTITNSFGVAWQQYSKDMGDNATPKGFRAYLEAHEKDDPKFATALDYLNRLRNLLGMIKNLGLTDTEFSVSQKVLLSKVRPANIKEEDFLDVVSGPSSRTNGATALK